MSIDNSDAELLMTGSCQRTVEQHQTPKSPVPPVYPSSGAFQHLPIRHTLAGVPVQAHPNTNKIFLHDLPAHCYSLPSLSLNFTIVEILVLLPNWFKNKPICARFMNNNLTANVHFMILTEHRELQFANEHERDKARKTLTDQYRKTMRTITPGWTRAKHVAPSGWDPMLLAMDGFVPDDMRLNGYRRPASIPFCDLMLGVKKLPEGTHAGDLTRALQFALESPHNYMFPEDLSNILESIGRTQVTMAHTDRLIICQYVEAKRVEDQAKKTRSTHVLWDHTNVDGLLTSVRAREAQGVLNGRSGVPIQEAWVPVAQEQTFPARIPAQLDPVYGFQEFPQSPPQIMVIIPKEQAVGNQMYPALVNRSNEEMEMDVLLRQHLDEDAIQLLTPLDGSSYAPRQLLRECIEGNVAFDGSPLARAARFAQRPDQSGMDWCVEHVLWLIQLLEAAQVEVSS